jgi:CubicO group peptidase (beta-lactamase class C family)
MQLVEQGKIALDDPFNKYIKDFPTPNYKITIEHLLTHTSGLTDIFKIEGFGTNFWRQDYTKQEYLEFLKKGKVEFTPGTKFSYCNTGYILLGYIIEEVSGLTYQQYIKENIFKKAQLANSYNGTYHKIIKNRASGYGISETDGSIENLERVSWTIIGGAGSLMCNTEDFFKYYRALDTYKLISKKSLERTRTNYKLADGKESGYGFGIGVGKSKDRPVVSHTGGITGYFTSQMYFPDEEVHIIIFTNCEGYMSKDPVWKISEIIFEGVL